MTRPRVSFFIHDLTANPIARAAPLARALAAEYDVEMLGFVFDDGGIYEPYRGLFEYKTVRASRSLSDVVRSLGRLAALATGDIVYACKPLVTSFGAALIASKSRRAALVLDIEDDEWTGLGAGWPEFLWRDIIKGWRHATAWKYTRLIHPLTHLAHGVTVSSTLLQRRYGGVLVRHGADERLFDPARADLSRASCRADFGLPAAPSLALFAGVPQPHKGWGTLVAALQRPEARNWHLVVAGPADHPDFSAAVDALGPRCHALGPQPHDRMPALLAAVDAVPVPQRSSRFAEAQIPAKALEAMAMGVPLAASRVGDLPELLGGGLRGWLFDPGDDRGLARALFEIASDRPEARWRAAAAREWHRREAGTSANARRVGDLLRQVRHQHA